MEEQVALGGGGAFVSGSTQEYWLIAPEANNVVLAFIFQFFSEDHQGIMLTAEVKNKRFVVGGCIEA
jgi:hypothetical protein